MADKRISQLVDRGTVVNNDVIPIVVSGATTTNKATISSIQTFMQGNLDVGVTSVGITLGSSGTDVNVSGSPVTSSGNITINIPSASATNRGLVTTGAQTIAGVKTFSSDLIVNGITVGKGGASNVNNTAVGTSALAANTTGSSNTATGLSALLVNTGGNGNTANGYLSLQSNTTGGYNVSIGNQSMYSNSTGSNNTAVGNDSLYSNITGGKNTGIGSGAGYYIADGSTPNTTSDFSIYLGADTKASADNAQNEIVIGYNAIGNGSNTVTIGNSSITSNKLFGKVIHADAVNANESATLGQVNTALGGYVTLATTQTITAQKTFTTSGGTDSVIISTTGAGFALDAIKAGNGEVIRVNKTSGTGNAMTVIGGNFEAPTIVKTGGTSAQFLKADGSVDSSTYLTTGTAASTYVPYTGATTSVDLGDNVLTSGGLNIDNLGGFGGALNLRQATSFSTWSGAAFTSIYATPGNNLIINFSNDGRTITLNGSLVSAASPRTFTFPDATGTLALTTDLGAYLPLAGGTLTGALNGTSASFNGSVSSANTSGSAGSVIISGSQANVKNYQLTNLIPGVDNTGFVIRNTTDSRNELAFSGTGAATFASSVTATQATFTATANTYAGGALILKQFGGTNPIYLTSVSGVFALSNGGSADHLTIASTGAATFSSSVTASGAKSQFIASGGASAGAGISLNTGLSGADRRNWFIGTEETVAGDFQIKCSTAAGGVGGSGDTRLAILNNGNVGIGTASPSHKLQIQGSSDSGIRLTDSSGNTRALLNPSGVQHGEFTLFNNSGNATTYLGGGAGSNYVMAQGGNFLIGTTSSSGIGTGSSVNQGVEIGSGLISIQTNNNSNNYWSKATGYTSGDFTAHFVNGVYVGGISTNGTTTTYAVASDYRLKEDFQEINGLEKVQAIKVYDYKWNTSDERMDGVIAHELAEVLPYAVIGEKDAERMQSVDYSKIVPILIKAIQEQQEQIDSLKNQIQDESNA